MCVLGCARLCRDGTRLRGGGGSDSLRDLFGRGGLRNRFGRALRRRKS